MIFVTVGTHEQQFDRLVKKVDELKGRNLIREQVVIQTGFSTYEPSNCIWKQWLRHDEIKAALLRRFAFLRRRRNFARFCGSAARKERFIGNLAN